MTEPIVLFVVSDDTQFLTYRLATARAVRELGFRVHVAARVGSQGGRIAQEGFEVHPLPLRRGGRSPLAFAAGVAALRRLLGRLRPDILHAFTVQSVVTAGIAAAGSGIPSVLSLTGVGSVFLGRAGMTGAAVRTALAGVLRTCGGRVVVQNPDDLATVLGLGVPAARIALIRGSGVDVERFRPLPEPAAPFTAAYVGRMIEDKGVRAVVEAHRMLRARLPEARLLLAGAPDPSNPGSVPQPEFEAWSREPGVEARGTVEDVRTVWRDAHAAVLASRREGLPLSLLEAAACGRPAVATDVPGCREAVRDGINGVLVPPDDPGAITDALERLARDHEARGRMAAAGRRMAEEEFSSALVGAQTAALYRDLLASGRSLPTAAGGDLPELRDRRRAG
jgi:glycosyltransferase involved in cell wall biosynthesis